jgi:hypothetical protein
MKILLTFFLLSLASISFSAESCSFAVKDRYGYEYETVTRASYSAQGACSDAEYACRELISDAQARGRYLDANCAQKSGPVISRPPEPPSAMGRCTTDLVNYYNTVVRSFTASGRTQMEACNESARQCKIELSRQENYGSRCVPRTGGQTPPRPPRQTTESCTARRYDPAGYFIQSYLATYTGPTGSDVKGEACRRAFDTCSYDIKGRQTCRIER